MFSLRYTIIYGLILAVFLGVCAFPAISFALDCEEVLPGVFIAKDPSTCPPEANLIVKEGTIVIGSRDTSGDSETWLENIVTRAINYFFLVGMVIAPLIILIGAFMFFTSGGDPARTQSAKRLILWAAIGLAILLLAKAITSIIKYILQID